MARSVRAEIKQGKPFSSLEQEAFIALARTADQLLGRSAEIMKEHGLSPTQYNALRILRGAGTDGLACREIGERMINRDPDITRLIDRMEKRGLVKRARNQKDRRVMTTRITDRGLEILRALDRPVEECNRAMLGHLGQNRLRSLIRLLQAARKYAGPDAGSE